MPRARCVSKKELSNMRLSIFQFTLRIKPDEVSPTNFQVLTEDHELQLVWTVGRRSNFNLGLQSAEKNVFGVLVAEEENKKIIKSTFDYLNLPFVQKLSTFLAGRPYCAKITIYVYRPVELANPDGDYAKFSAKKEKDADVVFVVGEEEIPAYKHIMTSCSDVFTSMFGADMLEKNTGRVKVTDVKPNVFKLMVRFIETGKFDSDDFEEVTEVIHAADKYSIQTLIDVCGYRLSNWLSVDNACYLLILAELVKAEFFKQDCLNFITENKHKLASTNCYKQMVKTSPDLISELFLQEKITYMD